MNPRSVFLPAPIRRFLRAHALLLGGAAAGGLAPSLTAADRIVDKTLVAWVAPANLEQRGGSVLTLDDAKSHFDGIVLGEITPGRWMAGSDFYRRTDQKQDGWPAETSGSGQLVQIAIVYRGTNIALFRDGQPYAAYSVNSAPQEFGPSSVVVIGKRHLDQGDSARFIGAIEDARIYASALTAEQLAALKPNEASQPAPLAWWDFNNGRAVDRQGRYPTTTLTGDARIANGRLVLGGKDAGLVATADSPELLFSAAGRNDENSAARTLREKLLADRHRPLFHFAIPEGTAMPFDPNGAIFWKGRYHLFYIFQDRRGHNWGHVSSTDLFHWRHHPTGLVSGMFSGNCFVNHEGRPTMCYHQVGQGNAMAVALDDDLNEWKKLDSNPITPKTQPGDPLHGKYSSWDPYGWLEGNTYYAIFGGKRAGLAKAPSLAGEWKYVGDFLANTVDGVALNEDISCADFFRLGDRHMLLCISHDLGCRYYLGDWKGEQFHPTFHAKMSWVDHSFFAPESLLDDRGRRIFWAWLMDQPGFKTRAPQGWSGTMSLPRVLTLAPDGGLRMNPPEEIERLRYHPRHQSDLTIPADGELPLDALAGSSQEILLEVASGSTAREFGVIVARSADGSEQTPVFCDLTGKRLGIDTTRSSLTDGPKSVEAGPFEPSANEPVRLRIFIDHSVVEVFANDGRQAVMRRIYPSRADATGVRLFARGGAVKVTRLDAWELSPSNPY